MKTQYGKRTGVERSLMSDIVPNVVIEELNQTPTELKSTLPDSEWEDTGLIPFLRQ